jgi:hypothetical protein
VSQFRVKGMGVIHDRAWLDERLGAGWFTRTAREHQPDWPDRLLPGEWYPAHTFVYVYKRAHEQIGGYGSMKELVEVVAGETATNDLNGALRAFLWVASPKMFLRTVPRIFDNYINFGTSEVLSNEVGRCLIKVGGIPADILDWLSPAISGFLSQAVKLAGGKDPQAKISEVKQMPNANTWEFVCELTYG